MILIIVFSFLLYPKDIFTMMMLDKRSNELVKSTGIYGDLIKLQNTKVVYKFSDGRIIQQYYSYGLINVLKQYRYRHKQGVNSASAGGHVNVLQWLKNSGLPFSYTAEAINEASTYNRISVLDWWKESELKLRYTEDAIDQAAANGHVSVLEWWKILA